MVTSSLLFPATAAAQKTEARQTARFKHFHDRVAAYIELEQSVEATLPKLKPTDQPEKIQAYQGALARTIREARPHARRGDIFGRKGTAFRRTIAEVLLGPQARHARATILQTGDLPKAVRLRVNRPYPEGVPYTTFPPTLLRALPQLPEQLAYRIVARDLALVDVKANLVIDFIHEALP